MEKSRDSFEKPDKSRANRRRCRPLWKKIVVCPVAAVALFGLYILWFVSAKPTPTVDYVALLNRKNRPSDQQHRDNAWPHYKKAIKLFVWLNSAESNSSILGSVGKKFSERSKTEQAEILEWIGKNDAAWKEFVEASLKPYCHIEYVVSAKNPRGLPTPDTPTFRLDMKHLGQLRSLFMLGLWQSRISMERSHIQQALSDCLSVINAGRHLDQRELLTEQLAGLWANSIGNRQVLEVVSSRKLSAVELKNLQQRLSDMLPDKYPTIDMEYERLMFLDMVQHTFTRRGIGGGHLIPKFLPLLVQSSGVIITMRELETKPTLKQRALYTAISIVHARRDKTIARYDEMCDQFDEITEMTPYERRAANISFGINRPHIFNYVIHFDSFIKESRYFLPEVLMPAVDRIAEVTYQARGLNVATRTVLALQRWRLDTGEYPASLKQLVEAGYLNELPMDPFSNKSFVYEKVDGDFTLYSVGRNFRDDKGEIAYQGKTHIALWGTPEKGDAVFWPVP